MSLAGMCCRLDMCGRSHHSYSDRTLNWCRRFRIRFWVQGKHTFRSDTKTLNCNTRKLQTYRCKNLCRSFGNWRHRGYSLHGTLRCRPRCV